MAEDKKKAKLFGKKQTENNVNSAQTNSSEMNSNKDKLTDRERIEQGQLLCKVIIEVLGKPKEHVESTIKEYVHSMKQNKSYHVVSTEFQDAIDVEGGMFSVFAEVEMWSTNIAALLNLAYDYMPSSIEIIEPETLVYKGNTLSSFINDMLARMHQIDMLVKNLRAENRVLKNNLSNSLKKSVLLVLKDKELSSEEIAKKLEIRADKFEAILDNFVKEEPRIKKDGEKYHL